MERRGRGRLFLTISRKVLTDFHSLLESVTQTVTQEMNDNLMGEFKHVEIKMALESIGDLKALGPDGLPSVFYKN